MSSIIDRDRFRFRRELPVPTTRFYACSIIRLESQARPIGKIPALPDYLFLPRA